MTNELAGILQISIAAKQIGRATAFYKDTLGLNLLMEGPNMAFLDCGGTRIYLDANPATAEGGAGSMIYFRTTDIDRLHSSYVDRGVSIHQAPHIIARLADRDVWLMWIRDSESNLLGIMEERRK